MPLFFLLALADGEVTIAHCPPAVTDALHAQLDAEAAGHAVVTCAERVVLLTRDDQHRLVARAGLSDAELATRIVETLREIQALPPELPLETNAPRADDHHQLELWVEPFGTLAALTVSPLIPLSQINAFYFKAGVTVPVSPEWELVISAGVFTVASNSGSGDSSRATQVWLSVAPVRFWRVAVGGPRSGFYFGPKLSAVVMHRDLPIYTELDRDVTDPAVPSADAFAAELGWDAGFRVQVGRVDLTFVLPSVSFGFTTDRSRAAIMPLGSSNSAYDIDFNLIRLGVSL